MTRTKICPRLERAAFGARSAEDPEKQDLCFCSHMRSELLGRKFTGVIKLPFQFANNC